MRRLKLLRDLLSLPAIGVALLIALLGNLNSILVLVPQLPIPIGNLLRSEWVAPLLTWLARNGPPNWLFVVLTILLLVLFERSYRKLSDYYLLRPDVVLSSKVETIRTENTVMAYARLEAHNRHERALTECYATLETATNLIGSQSTPVTKIRNYRLRWADGSPSSDDCKTTLPPRSARTSIAVADTADGFQFSACTPSTFDSRLVGLYLIKIRVDGKLNDKAIDPQYFNGYLYVGKDKKHEGLTIIFEKGDWRSDRRLPKPQPE